MSQPDVDDHDEITYLDNALDASVQRRCYLLTYSQADMTMVGSRERFVDMVLLAIHDGKQSNNFMVTEYACCIEEHEQTDGFHYHTSVNLARPMRWKAVKERLSSRHGVVVNFSAQGRGYAWAARYVTKTDINALLSEGHKNYDPINLDSSIAFGPSASP